MNQNTNMFKLYKQQSNNKPVQYNQELENPKNIRPDVRNIVEDQTDQGEQMQLE